MFARKKFLFDFFCAEPTNTSPIDNKSGSKVWANDHLLSIIHFWREQNWFNAKFKAKTLESRDKHWELVFNATPIQ